MSLPEDSSSKIDDLKVTEIDKRLLNEFGTKITGNRARKLYVLKCYIAREKSHQG